MSEQTQALAPKNDLRTLINSDRVKAEIIRALPSHVTPDRFIRVMLTALTKTPKLMECTQESVMRCMMDCSALGIEPDGRRVHLIPYGKECTLIIDYKGLVELVRRSGNVTSIRAEHVCENDEFSWENGVLNHRIDWRKPRGEIQAVYAEAKLASGETQTAVMTREEVEGIRKRSKAGSSGPWVTDWGEMAKKTPLRRLVKLLPLSADIAEAIDRDGDRVERNVTPGKASRVPVIIPALPAAAHDDPKKPKESPTAVEFWAQVGELDKARVESWLTENNKTPETATKEDIDEIVAYCF
jgi:recombination protein RecT